MSGQVGPVEPGAAPVIAPDLDRALAHLATYALQHRDQAGDEAVGALQTLVDRARQYVAGPTSGRLAALCQVLQEPVPERIAPVSAETVAQAYLTERGLVAISREAAGRLGVHIP